MSSGVSRSGGDSPPDGAHCLHCWVVRTFHAPADPRERPLRRRSTVRVLVVDEDERLLLVGDSDPGTGARWWITPGGGIDPGESEIDAVVRELHEETGLVVAEPQIIGPLATRRVWHGYSDVVVDQHDTFYAVRTPAFKPVPADLTEEELVTVHGLRWWSPAEIRDTDEVIWPVDLVDLLALIDGTLLDPVDEALLERTPAREVPQLATVEESSVEIGSWGEAR